MRPERVYEALLRAYPPGFRRDYGPAMVEAFSQLLQASRGSRFSFWRFVLIDLAKSACAEQIDACRTGRRRLALEWAGACACGAVATALLANLLTWTFTYLYHPFFEGVSLPPWSYGAVLGLTLGFMQSVLLRKRFQLGIAWVAATAAGTAAGLEAAISIARVAGPVAYGVVLGSVVGGAQWMVVRRRSRRSAARAVCSALAFSIVLLSVAVNLHTTFDGLNAWTRAPLSPRVESRDAVIQFLTRGLLFPANGADLAIELAVMIICGLVVAAWTFKPLRAAHDHQERL